MDWAAVGVSLKLAVCTTAILAAGGLPLAYWLASGRGPLRAVVFAAVSVPLVLPPTVVGFYLLTAAGPHSPPGRMWADAVGRPLPFTFPGILAASVVVNLPFAVRPFAAALAAVDRRLIEASWCLGVSRAGTFFRVVVPLAWPGVLAGLVLTFAHTVGEFGVVLMVGGNVPGETRTLSVSLYDDVQAMEYATAGRTSAVLVGFAFAVLALTQLVGLRVRGA